MPSLQGSMQRSTSNPNIKRLYGIHSNLLTRLTEQLPASPMQQVGKCELHSPMGHLVAALDAACNTSRKKR